MWMILTLTLQLDGSYMSEARPATWFECVTAKDAVCVRLNSVNE